MGGSDLFDTAVSLVWVKLVEKGLGSQVADSGDKVHSGLESGMDGCADWGVDLGDVTRNRHDDNGDVRGWENKLGPAWMSGFVVLVDQEEGLVVQQV